MELKLNGKVIFIDFETTGLDPVKNQIIEYATIVYENGRETLRESQCVKLEYGQRLSEFIEKLTGYNEDYLNAHGITLHEAYERLKEIIGFDGSSEKPVIIAHNCQFDASFLDAMSVKFDGKRLEANFFDTLTVCRTQQKHGNRLAECCERYGIVIPRTHEAMNDTQGLAKLTNALLNEKSDYYSKFLNRFGYSEKYGKPEYLLAGVEYFPQ